MAYTLQLLHASDLEGGVDALSRAPNFAAIVDTLEDDFANTVVISAGDNYIPGPFFSTAADFSMGGVLTDAYTRYFTELLGIDLDGITLDLGRGGGRVDISIMNVIGFDASAIGNHEFDPGITAFAEIIRSYEDEGAVGWIGATFPYLSANIDFSAAGALASSYTTEILDAATYDESLEDILAGETTPDIAPATLIEENGELIGVVGATTQIIETISSTGNAQETTGGGNNMAALAAVIQPQIDALIDAGANKIIVASHLQQFALEQELAGLLSGVDIIIAGGSDTRLADETDRLRDGEEAAATYPFLTEDADGNPVAIVSTDGEYSYVGRLVVEFDDDGVLMTDSIDDAISGAFVTDDQGVLDVTGAATIEDAFAASLKADIVEDLTSAVAGIVEEKDAITYGNHDVYLDGRRETVRTEESNMGDLSADANLAAARQADDTVMLSFKNGGGIRAEIGSSENYGLTAGDGALSQLDIENSLRFNNGLALVTLTVEGLLMLLEHGVAETDSEAGSTPGRFPQIGGFRFSFDESQPAQVLATDDEGNYIVDEDTGMPMVEVAGSRVRTVAITDPETGEDIVIVRDGEVTADAPETVRMVALNFLVDGNGDGYPFQELGTDIQYITYDEGTIGVTDDGDAETLMGEQTALATYFEENFPDEDSAFAQGETDVFNDARIVQLALNGGIDRILLDEGSDRYVFSQVHSLESGETELFTGGSEVVNVEDGMAYVTNGAQGRIDVFDIGTGEAVTSFDLTGIAGFDGVQSVDVANGVIAAAVAREDDANGVIAFFDTEGTALGQVEVGNLPDMVTFTPDGMTVLVANEGEPTDEADPLGSVSIIDISGGVEGATAVTLDFTAFDGTEDALRAQGILIEPGKSASEDLEPEYITVTPDGSTAWVALQEANAYAVIDLETNEITALRSFGLVDRSMEGFEIDASNDDNAINLTSYDNLFGMRQPDGIQAFEIDGEVYVFTANEGDSRDATEADIEDLTLDPTAFPTASQLQREENLGNLAVRSDLGDIDDDGDYDALYAYGARSFTVYNAAGDVVFDSGSQFAQIIAEIRPELFNADDGEFDGRSDNKGVEPEAIAVGNVEGTPMVFVGLERDNGIMVFDASTPASPSFVGYLDSEEYGHLSPETIAFISAEDSATGNAQIVVAYEGDGNTAVYDIDDLTVTRGTAGDDTLVGSDRGETIYGGDGTDDIQGGASADTIFGGATEADLRDTIRGGNGDDQIDGGYGNDLLEGGAGDDTLLGGFGADQLAGQSGNDLMTGGALSDLLLGGAGDDFVNGGFGFDRITGGDGADRFYHLGDAGHGSDWVQDYMAAEGDVLVFGDATATADQFNVNFAATAGAGAGDVNEAFVTHVPSGLIVWALVDGAAQDEINLRIGDGDVFDLLA